MLCEYKRPLWWSNNEQRRKQKEDIKNIIKKTKTTEKTSSALHGYSAPNNPPDLSYSVPTSDTFSDNLGRATRASSVDSQASFENDFNQPFPETPDLYDPYIYATPQMGHPQFYHPNYPYEVDIKTERQMYVNDIPTRRDSSISTFSTFYPLPSHATVPSDVGDDLVQHDYYETRQEDWGGEEGLQFNFFDFSHGQQPHQSQSAVISVDECDRDLLNYFIDNVLRLIFPILDINQHGSVKNEVILPALESNKCYLHCCLSVAAIHLKASSIEPNETIDNDIMRHRYATVSELCKALNRDSDHLQNLEATLAMIFFQCSVGRPDDCLPDIPWHQHFQAALSLLTKLDLPRVFEELPHTNAQPPFNMTLTSWIDILGSTMLGKAPLFAHTYRTLHLSGAVSGLCELMGCEDRVMYLLSEVACLDNLKLERKVDDITLCTMITSLAQQLDATEAHHDALEMPYSVKTKAIRPKQLSKNITAIYRIAARVYLCSLVPEYNRYQPSTINLIARVSETLHFIPSGPDGFDRSLVWPLLICGAQSIPTAPFRRVCADRCEQLGEAANFGSFSRMTRVLQEVWRRADEISMPQNACQTTPQTASTDHPIDVKPITTTITSPTIDTSISMTTPSKNQSVHWRDVMQQNGWDFLLI